MKNIAHLNALLLVFSIGLLSCIIDLPPLNDPFADSDPGPMLNVDDLRYNEFFRKACHNCFEKQYAQSLGEALNHVNTIEIDFWETKDGISGGKVGKWYVRHNPVTLNVSGNDNCCTAGPNGTNDMDACLRNIADWSNNHPDHDVITVYIDKKDSWSEPMSQRDPAGLDNLLSSIFGPKLYTPVDLQASYTSPRDAIINNAWPKMEDLKGKVLFVITGSSSLLNYYVENRLADANCFIAPRVSSESQVASPNAISTTSLEQVVFYNMSYSGNEIQAATAVRNLGAVGRTWGLPEVDAQYQAVIGADVHVVALYDFMESGFNGGVMSGGW